MLFVLKYFEYYLPQRKLNNFCRVCQGVLVSKAIFKLNLLHWGAARIQGGKVVPFPCLLAYMLLVKLDHDGRYFAICIPMKSLNHTHSPISKAVYSVNIKCQLYATIHF